MILKNVLAIYTKNNYEREDLLEKRNKCYETLRNSIKDNEELLLLLNNYKLCERALREFDITHELQYDTDFSMSIHNIGDNRTEYEITEDK